MDVTQYFLQMKPFPVLQTVAIMMRTTTTPSLQDAWTRAKKKVEEAQKQQKRQYDKKSRMPVFAEGDRVFVYKPSAKSCKAYKFARPFHGPYRIIKLYDNGVDVRPVDRPQDSLIRVPFNRLRVCPEEIPNQIWPQKTAQPTTVIDSAVTPIPQLFPRYGRVGYASDLLSD